MPTLTPDTPAAAEQLSAKRQFELPNLDPQLAIIIEAAGRRIHSQIPLTAIRKVVEKNKLVGSFHLTQQIMKSLRRLPGRVNVPAGMGTLQQERVAPEQLKVQRFHSEAHEGLPTTITEIAQRVIDGVNAFIKDTDKHFLLQPAAAVPKNAGLEHTSVVGIIAPATGDSRVIHQQRASVEFWSSYSEKPNGGRAIISFALHDKITDLRPVDETYLEPKYLPLESTSLRSRGTIDGVVMGVVIDADNKPVGIPHDQRAAAILEKVEGQFLRFMAQHNPKAVTAYASSPERRALVASRAKLESSPR